MKKTITMLLVSLALLMTHIVYAAPLQPNQATVKGLSLGSSMQQVVQVMGEPYRRGHWEFTYDTMYEYPGVNFVFLTKYGSLDCPMTLIILDAPQAALDNGLKVGVTRNTVMNTLGNDFKFDTVTGDLAYTVVIDPVTYKVGTMTFKMDDGVVQKIFIQRV